jgi:spore photoproduct lyase
MVIPPLDIALIYLELAVKQFGRGREILARFPEAERIPVASLRLPRGTWLAVSFSDEC